MIKKEPETTKTEQPMSKAEEAAEAHKTLPAQSSLILQGFILGLQAAEAKKAG